MPLTRILSTGPINEYATQCLEKFGCVEVTPDTSPEALMARLDGTVALVVRGEARITGDVFRKASELRVIGRTGVGYDTVDIAAATEHRIPVVYTPGAGARAVAEAAMAYMLALTKRIACWNGRMQAGDWTSRYGAENGDLDGATLGIIGFGRIGRLVAELAAPFNMRIVAHDPFVTTDYGDGEGAAGSVEMVSLRQLVAEADFITIHAALTDQNRGLINRELLQGCKRGACLVNLARGGIIESLDIICEALDDGRLAGAALDVFDPEPPDFTHPLFARDDCITSPHSMATSRGGMARIFKSMTDDMVAVLEGRQPQFVVNSEVLETG